MKKKKNQKTWKICEKENSRKKKNRQSRSIGVKFEKSDKVDKLKKTEIWKNWKHFKFWKSRKKFRNVCPISFYCTNCPSIYSKNFSDFFKTANFLNFYSHNVSNFYSYNVFFPRLFCTLTRGMRYLFSSLQNYFHSNGSLTFHFGLSEYVFSQN